MNSIILSKRRKAYLDEQRKLFEDEKHILDCVIRDSHDLLNRLYEYEMRIRPDANIPLFFDQEYTNFRKRGQANELLEMIRKKSHIFELFPYEQGK